jgi:XTP/dITP diphosphohydrolase
MANEGLIHLRQVMDQLRSPGGCPWDAEQTHESLIKYLIEETYETIDAIDSQDRDHLVEELGDLLLQVFFHARIGQERSEAPFDIDDVAAAISAKLIRRHPHVFPNELGEIIDAPDAAFVEQNWQTLKNAEKARNSVTDGVPISMPPLTQISKLVTRLINDQQNPPISPEIASKAEHLALSPEESAELILALIAGMQQSGVDVEGQMRKSVSDFRARIQAQELNK